MKRSVFVIIQRVDTGDVLFVIDGRNVINLPGGKAEPEDRNQFTTLRREFEEETKLALPFRDYDHFQWGTRKHTIRIYYTRMNPRTANELCERDQVRANDDPEEPVTEFRWLPPKQHENLQHHARHALRIWAKVDTRRRIF